MICKSSIWWKIVVVGLLLIILAIQLINLNPRYYETEQITIFRTWRMVLPIDRIDFIGGVCVNAEIYLPYSYLGEVWILTTNDNKSGECAVRYKTRKCCMFGKENFKGGKE